MIKWHFISFFAAIMKENQPYIHLVSGPRNISTALMYSFAQRADLKVVDEPYYAYYLLKSGKVHPGQEEILASQPHSVSEVENELKIKAAKTGLFIKNMAHHMEYVTLDYLSLYHQVFLIREPKALISSFSKVIPNPDMQDIGLKTELELYQWLTQQVGNPPVILDSGEVLKNPEGVLKQLCKVLEMDWDKNMLHWPIGARPEDGVWAKYWYKNVHNSNGFIQQQKVPRLLPVHCEELYAQAAPIYNILFEKAIKA